MDKICVRPKWSQRSFCAAVPRGVTYIAAPNASGKTIVSNLMLSAMLYNYYYIDMVVRHSEDRVADSDEFIVENANEILNYVMYPLFSSEAETIRGNILSHRYRESRPVVLKLAPLFAVTLDSISSLENEWKILSYSTSSVIFEYEIVKSLYKMIISTIDYLRENLLKHYTPDQSGRLYIISNEVIEHAISLLEKIKDSLEIRENDRGYRCEELEAKLDKHVKRLDVNELMGKLGMKHAELEVIEDRIMKLLAESTGNKRDIVGKYKSITTRLDAARSRVREIEDKIKKNVSEFKKLYMDQDLDGYVYRIADDDKILSDGIDVSRIVNSMKKAELESELQQIDSDIKNLSNIYNNINNLKTDIVKNIIESLASIRDSFSKLISTIDNVKNKVKDDIFNANLVETICSRYSFEKCNDHELTVYAHSGMVISNNFSESLDKLKNNISKLSEELKTNIGAFNKETTTALNILKDNALMLNSIISDLESRRKHLNTISEKINNVVDIAEKINELISDRNKVTEQISSLEREKKTLEKQLQIVSTDGIVNEEYKKELEALTAEKSRLLQEIEEINKEIEKAKKENEAERKIEVLKERCELIDKINKILDKIENRLVDIMKRLNLMVEVEGVRKYKVYAMSDSLKVIFATMRSFAFLKLVNEILRDYIELRFGTNMKIPLVVDAIVLSQLDSNNKREFLKMIVELSSEMDQPVLIFDIADRYISREIKSDSDIDEIISHSVASVSAQN